MQSVLKGALEDRGISRSDITKMTRVRLVTVEATLDSPDAALDDLLALGLMLGVSFGVEARQAA